MGLSTALGKSRGRQDPQKACIVFASSRGRHDTQKASIVFISRILGNRACDKQSASCLRQDLNIIGTSNSCNLKRTRPRLNAGSLRSAGQPTQ